MNLKDRLARLEGLNKKPDPGPEPSSPADWVAQLAAELQISVLERDKSFVLVKENTYPIYRDPLFAERRDLGFDAPCLYRLTGDGPQHPHNLSRMLFIDTETTGLAGGTGTYAFLVGVGTIELDHVRVRQFLLPDFAGEWLMLEELTRMLEASEATISFNGKSFDLPLLRTRFVLNSMVPVLEDMHHIDLLHAARRIWRRRLPACDLQSLERHILGEERVGDIPGSLIPQLYFEFIRKRQALLLRDVLEHNFHDIVHLARLAVVMSAIAEAPHQHLSEPEDLYSVARYFHYAGHFPEAADLIRTLLETPEDLAAPMLDRLTLMLAMTLKKMGEWEEVGQFFLSLRERGMRHPVFIEEYAKYLEHRRKDYREALLVVGEGLSYLDRVHQLNPASPLMKFKAPLRHRRGRLTQRLANKKGG